MLWALKRSQQMKNETVNGNRCTGGLTEKGLANYVIREVVLGIQDYFRKEEKKNNYILIDDQNENELH